MAFEFELRWAHQTKRVFVGINILGIVGSVIGFIIALIKFEDPKYQTWNTASFIGGSVAAVSMFYFIYFSSALIAIRLKNSALMTIYMIFTYSSLLIRITTLVLFVLYGMNKEKDEDKNSPAESKGNQVQIAHSWEPYLFLLLEFILGVLAHSIRRVMIEEAPLTNPTLSPPSSPNTNNNVAVPIERRNSLEEREKRYMKH